jgi:hypothetical protein
MDTGETIGLCGAHAAQTLEGTPVHQWSTRRIFITSLILWGLLAAFLWAVEGPRPASAAGAVTAAPTASQVAPVVRAHRPCNWRDARACGRNQRIGRLEAASRGWHGRQWVCLKRLWYRESGWSTRSGAPSRSFGIPQALPGHKMAAAGPDWRTNPRTQIRWGLRYVKSRYQTPCSAWAHWQSHRWY